MPTTRFPHYFGQYTHNNNTYVSRTQTKQTEGCFNDFVILPFWCRCWTVYVTEYTPATNAAASPAYEPAS